MKEHHIRRKIVRAIRTQVRKKEFHPPAAPERYDGWERSLTNYFIWHLKFKNPEWRKGEFNFEYTNVY